MDVPITSIHIGRAVKIRYLKYSNYEGCPSKSWTFVIKRVCVKVILWYFQDVFIYLWEPFCITMGGIAVQITNL